MARLGVSGERSSRNWSQPSAPDRDSFVIAQQLFFLAHYDIGGAHLETSSSGSLLCGSPEPSAEIEIPGLTVDVLNGPFGVCP